MCAVLTLLRIGCYSGCTLWSLLAAAGSKRTPFSDPRNLYVL